jgi:hypothetical protein
VPSFSSTTFSGLPWQEVRRDLPHAGAELEFQLTGMSYMSEVAHHLKKSRFIPVKGNRCPWVLPVRYEHNLHIKK